MPHEVADLEPLLMMLSKQDRDDVQVMQLVFILLTLQLQNMNPSLTYYYALLENKMYYFILFQYVNSM